MAFATIDKLDQASEPKLSTLPIPQGWQEISSFASWIPDYDTPPATLQAAFSKDANQVGLYVAYYRNQDYRRKLVTSTNTLASTTNPFWSMTARSVTNVVIEGVPGTVRETRLLGKDTTPAQSLIVWQWYWVNGRLVTSDAEAKLQTALSRLRGAGDDSAVIMVYAPTESAHQALTDFAASAAPTINNWLMATRNVR